MFGTLFVVWSERSLNIYVLWTDTRLGGRFGNERTITIPHSLRTSVSYKIRLRHDLEAMFRYFGTPEVFGTWSVNMSSPAFSASLPHHQDAIKDVPLFCATYNREWHRVWGYIRGTWAEKVLGGLRAFCWVTEYQDRGVPHVHYVLWTRKNLAELVQQNNRGDAGQVIVSCSSKPQSPELEQLVLQHQVHRHTRKYCLHEDKNGAKHCRFGFPKPQNTTTMVDEKTGQVWYERRQGDEWINGYNPEILGFARSNIDIQLNISPGTLLYMSKYFSDTSSTFQGLVPETQQSEYCWSIQGVCEKPNRKKHVNTRVLILSNWSTIVIPMSQQQVHDDASGLLAAHESHNGRPSKLTLQHTGALVSVVGMRLLQVN